MAFLILKTDNYSRMVKGEDMQKKNILAKVIGRGEIGTVILIIILGIITGCINENFLQIDNFVDILRTASYTFMVALAVTFLMIAGEMDLSIGAAISLGSVMVAKSFVEWGFPIWVGVLVAVALGACVGLVNALLVIKINLPAFIITLGTQYVLYGLLSVITNNTPITGLPTSFKVLGQGRLAGIPYTVYIVVILGIIAQFVLSYTKYGRNIFAVGGNRETAYVSGIDVFKIKSSVYVLTSVCAVISGIMMCSRFSSGQPAAGSGKEMTIMAAVIIGGTSLFGGIGSISGSFMGCLLFALISNVLVFMGVSTTWQNVVFGAILIFSLILDKYRIKINEKL